MNVCDSSSLNKKGCEMKLLCITLLQFIMDWNNIFFLFPIFFQPLNTLIAKLMVNYFFLLIRKKIKRTRTNINKNIKIVMEGHRV
jgi:hypothetical protein